MIATTQERRVLSTRYRVREFSTAGEISEAYFDGEADARTHEASLVGTRPGTATLLVVERLDVVASDGRRPDHVEAVAILRQPC
ncbi:MAG: hypothetical protein E6G57_02825 [Actinobacteria bacterium]|nr:MAG: hypothetical protein E6G57_02825 [Actinomycetota bacterium]